MCQIGQQQKLGSLLPVELVVELLAISGGLIGDFQKTFRLLPELAFGLGMATNQINLQR